MRGRMFLLSILSILLFTLLFSHPFGTALKTSISTDFHEENNTIMKTSNSTWVKNEDHLYIFSKDEYLNITRKVSENVIVFLVGSPSGDSRSSSDPYTRLRQRISQLDERLGDNCSTGLIIFHTGYPFRSDIKGIMEATRRQVEFVNIDPVFYKFSPDFKPHMTEPTWSKRGKWNYHHMCYFWFKQVFELKIMKRYRYMMRLDDDSQLLGSWPNVFDLMVKNQALYLANVRDADYEHVLPGMIQVRNVTMDFINKYKITVKNPDMFADLFKKATEVPNYWNNIEVIDLSLIRRSEVASFLQAVDESKGIFLYRWGDAPLRYILLALFVEPSRILHREKLGLAYCHPC